MNDQLFLFDLPECASGKNSENSETFCKGKPRFNAAIRNQVEFVNSSLDDLIPDDHQVRNILNYVEQMDLSAFYDKIKSTSGNPGRPPIDPKI
jgi:hypothetical protein